MRLFSVFVAFFAISAAAHTGIYSDAGTAYTLTDNEHVYGSKARRAYQKKDYDNGNVYFTHKKPNDLKDPEATPTDGMEPGSPEWCEAYVPYQNGYTWDDQLYERGC